MANWIFFKLADLLTGFLANWMNVSVPLVVEPYLFIFIEPNIFCANLSSTLTRLHRHNH